MSSYACVVGRSFQLWGFERVTPPFGVLQKQRLNMNMYLGSASLNKYMNHPSFRGHFQSYLCWLWQRGLQSLSWSPSALGHVKIYESIHESPNTPLYMAVLPLAGINVPLECRFLILRNWLYGNAHWTHTNEGHLTFFKQCSSNRGP